jgi:hypothetical protein
MKTFQLILLTLTLFSLSCSVGVKTDLLTGLKTTNNGLSYENVYLSTDEARLANNEFNSGKKIHMNFEGVQGFTLKDEKVNLGASIVVTETNGNKIIDFPDLFETYTTQGASPEEVSSIDLSITLMEKYTVGSKYKWSAKIWDKNGKGFITGEVEFVVK